MLGNQTPLPYDQAITFYRVHACLKLMYSNSIIIYTEYFNFRPEKRQMYKR